ncbi:MAG: glutathione-dependent reductase [Candidatus Melainabacteria bacterium HGW-Melainabacteria-1]|nr:MAG: glutathione-dependent reductase [Candidatus Melainabacteria bacterium HGW-Melainabacteria-1]
MGHLIEGKWTVGDLPSTADGRFVRKSSAFRNWITPDGSPGPSGQGGYPAQAGRYHLYVSLACPWAHRTLIFRRLKGLEALVSLSVVNALMGADGWTFTQGESVIPDPVMQAQALHELYSLAAPDYTGRATVPVLWDKQTRSIVSNESAEIIRMFNSAFDGLGAAPGDYYPQALRPEIDALNAEIYAHLNNGVYRAGFASTQAAYEEAANAVFRQLDALEARLSDQAYLLGTCLTEADWRLFTTLIRFDAVYVGHFKCNRRRILDYPQLWAYLRELYQMPGIADTVDIEQIKQHYYRSHESINPTRIVPVGPLLDLWAPHGREHIREAC